MLTYTPDQPAQPVPDVHNDQGGPAYTDIAAQVAAKLGDAR